MGQQEGQGAAIITAAMTTVIAIATVVYAYYSYGLLEATKSSIELTQEIFKATNRPYVGIISHEIQEYKKNKQLVIIFKVKNYGNIPANDITITTDFESAGIREYKTGFDMLPVDQPTVLHPDETMDIPVSFKEEPYTAMKNSWREAKLTMEIKYKGLLEQQYQSVKLWRYNGGGNVLYNVGGLHK